MEKSVQHNIQTAVTPSKELASGLDAFDRKKKILPWPGVKPRYMGCPAREFVTITDYAHSGSQFTK
jgi:hypothetical protein